MACWCKGKQSLLWLPWKQVCCSNEHQQQWLCQNHCPPLFYRLFFIQSALWQHYCLFWNCFDIYKTVFPCVVYVDPFMMILIRLPFENQKAEDNLHVHWVISPFLNNSLPWKDLMRYEHCFQISLPFLLCLLFPFALKLSSPAPSAQLFPRVSHPCLSTHSVGVTVLHLGVGGCSANLNHIGWTHLWKQMSTGAGMLFLFRMELLLSATPPPPPPPPSSPLSFSPVPSGQALPWHPYRKSP